MTKTDLSVEVIGEDGNIFNIVGKVVKVMKHNGYKELANEMKKEVFEQKSYDSALQIIGSYVHLE